MQIQQIIAKAKKNDQAAFRQLFDIYYRQMFSTGYRILIYKP